MFRVDFSVVATEKSAQSGWRGATTGYEMGVVLLSGVVAEILLEAVELERSLVAGAAGRRSVAVSTYPRFGLVVSLPRQRHR